jgi:hypothetical protein
MKEVKAQAAARTMKELAASCDGSGQFERFD